MPQLAQSKTGKIDTSSSFLRFESAFAHTRYLFSSHTLSEGWRSLSFKYFSLLSFFEHSEARVRENTGLFLKLVNYESNPESKIRQAKYRSFQKTAVRQVRRDRQQRQPDSHASPQLNARVTRLAQWRLSRLLRKPPVAALRPSRL